MAFFSVSCATLALFRFEILTLSDVICSSEIIVELVLQRHRSVVFRIDRANCLHLLSSSLLFRNNLSSLTMVLPHSVRVIPAASKHAAACTNLVPFFPPQSDDFVARPTDIGGPLGQ